MRCTRFVLTLALLWMWPAAAPAREHRALNGFYDIHIRVAGDGVEISGAWRRPPENVGTRSLQFLLTPLVARPHISLRCGRSPIAISSLSHAVDGGDFRWTAEFDRPCPAGRRISMHFSYAIANAAAPQLRTSSQQGFAGGSGELWYPQTNYSWRETGRVAIDTPVELAAIAAGAPRHSRNLRNRTISTFTVGAPAKFAFAYGRYRVATVAGGGIPVRVMNLTGRVDPEDVAERVAEATAPLAEAFGPPPFGALAVVEVDFHSLVLGTSEAAMLFVDSSEMAAEQADMAYWAHELAHQWWGVSLRAAPRTPGAMLLTEGLAQYAALMSLESALGVESAAIYRRANARHSIASYTTALEQAPDAMSLATALPTNQEETIQLHRLATSKGALAIDYFARAVGRERFHRTLRAFYREHQGGAASWQDLEQELQRVFGEDARTFLEQWLHRPGLPQLDLAWAPTPNGIHVHVRQTAQAYTLELPVLVVTQAGAVQHRLHLRNRAQDFDLDSGGAPVIGIIVDPAASVPMAPAVVRALARAHIDH